MTQEDIIRMANQCGFRIDAEDFVRPREGDYALRLERFAAAVLEKAQTPAWIPVSQQMPPVSRGVLAFYKNALGHGRIIRAEWIPAKTIVADTEDQESDYDEATDEFYVPQGWYEKINNWDDYSSVFVGEGTITHWMPLPAPPAQREDVGQELERV